MELNLKYEYSEEVIPPRCRKPRRQEMTGDISITIPEMTPENFPVAFIVTSKVIEDTTEENRVDLSNGKLYVKADRWSVAELQGFRLITRYDYMAQDDAKRRIREDYDRFHIFNGEVWEETTEPVYTINTFGFGGNHGGTAVMLDHFSNYRQGAYSLAVYRADEFDEVIQRGLMVAEERGDTESFESIKNTKDFYYIEVLMPEAIHLPRQAERKVTVMRHNVEQNLKEAGLEPVPTALVDYCVHKLWPEFSDHPFKHEMRDRTKELILGLVNEALKGHNEVIDDLYAYFLSGVERTVSGAWTFYVEEIATKFGVLLDKDSLEWQRVETRLAANKDVEDVEFENGAITIQYNKH